MNQMKIVKIKVKNKNKRKMHKFRSKRSPIKLL